MCKIILLNNHLNVFYIRLISFLVLLFFFYDLEDILLIYLLCFELKTYSQVVFYILSINY